MVIFPRIIQYIQNRQLQEHSPVAAFVIYTVKNTTISPDFLVWKLGEITAFTQ